MAAEDALAELAARLGSAVTFDRHGWIVWMDSFEEGLSKWEAVTGGTGAAAALDTTRSMHGLISAKLTTGSTGSYLAQIKRYSPFAVLNKFGVEIHATMHDSLDALYLILDIYTGSKVLDTSIAYEPSTNKLYYESSAGAMVELASDVNLYAYSYLFHAFKLVVNGESEEYVRLIVNDVLYDLAGVAVRTAADARAPYMEVSVMAVGDSGGNYSIYVDDVILTMNEP